MIFANSSHVYKYQMELMKHIHLESISKFKEKNNIKWFGLEFILNNQKQFRSVFINSLLKNLKTINELKSSA